MTETFVHIPEKLYSIPQGAKRIDTHFNTLYRADKRGELNTIEIAGRKFVSESELDRFALTMAARFVGTPYGEYRAWKAAQRTAAAE